MLLLGTPFDACGVRRSPLLERRRADGMPLGMVCPSE
jgi:hypothetical protein